MVVQIVSEVLIYTQTVEQVGLTWDSREKALL
jgi:hypothetical protein